MNSVSSSPRSSDPRNLPILNGIPWVLRAGAGPAGALRLQQSPQSRHGPTARHSGHHPARTPPS